MMFRSNGNSIGCPSKQVESTLLRVYPRLASPGFAGVAGGKPGIGEHAPATATGRVGPTLTDGGSTERGGEMAGDRPPWTVRNQTSSTTCPSSPSFLWHSSSHMHLQGGPQPRPNHRSAPGRRDAEAGRGAALQRHARSHPGDLPGRVGSSEGLGRWPPGPMDMAPLRFGGGGVPGSTEGPGV